MAEFDDQPRDTHEDWDAAALEWRILWNRHLVRLRGWEAWPREAEQELWDQAEPVVPIFRARSTTEPKRLDIFLGDRGGLGYVQESVIEDPEDGTRSGLFVIVSPTDGIEMEVCWAKFLEWAPKRIPTDD